MTAAAAVGFALAPHDGVAQGGNPRAATVQKVYPSAVRVQIASGGKVVRSASGIAFAHEDDRTYLLTNAHVVDPSRSWSEPVELRVLVSGEEKPRIARVVALLDAVRSSLDRGLDVARRLQAGATRRNQEGGA